MRRRYAVFDPVCTRSGSWAGSRQGAAHRWIGRWGRIVPKYQRASGESNFDAFAPGWGIVDKVPAMWIFGFPHESVAAFADSLGLEIKQCRGPACFADQRRVRTKAAKAGNGFSWTPPPAGWQTSSSSSKATAIVKKHQPTPVRHNGITTPVAPFAMARMALFRVALTRAGLNGTGESEP